MFDEFVHGGYTSVSAMRVRRHRKRIHGINLDKTAVRICGKTVFNQSSSLFPSARPITIALYQARSLSAAYA